MIAHSPEREAGSRAMIVVNNPSLQHKRLNDVGFR
jgi:hypothetical protein